MKPAPFAYHAPRTRDEALELLDRHGPEAKPLAGGQSLVPAMNFRLAQPAVLVDLNRVDDLAYVTGDGGGGLRIGAMARQRALEREAVVGDRAPLLRETMPHIAHPQIRNRGTVGGSLAHADPAAELPAVMAALGARVRLQSRTGERWLPLAEFYLGLFTTALAPGELLVEIAVPPMASGSGWAFEEVARRHGDYALVGVAALVQLAADGRCAQARVALLSVGEVPVLSGRAAAALAGERPTDEAIREAADAVQGDIEPMSDIHASGAYRRHLATVLSRRVLTRAFARSGAAGDG